VSDIQTDAEGFVVRDGERLINPFDGTPVTPEQLEEAREAKTFYAINAATFVLNVLENDGTAISEMLADEEIEPFGLLGGLSMLVIEILQKLAPETNPHKILFGYIEAQVPGLVESVFAAAEMDLVEEGVPVEEVAEAIAQAKADLTGG